MSVTYKVTSIFYITTNDNAELSEKVSYASLSVSLPPRYGRSYLP